MNNFLLKYHKILYIVMGVLCTVVGYYSKQYYLFIATILMLLMSFGILDNDDKNSKKVKNYKKEDKK